MAPESTIQELVRVALGVLSPIELGNSLEYAKEQVLKGLQRLLMSDLTLSISSFLRFPNSWDVDSLYDSPKTWALLLFHICSPHYPHATLDGFPLSFQHYSCV